MKPKVLLLLLLTCTVHNLFAQQGIKADKPLYRDPVEDGAADPAIVYNKDAKLYYMLYTNRRAKDTTLQGITWVHGTKIGIATSANGAKWTYKGECNFTGLNIDGMAYWAPDVVYYKKLYHMFVTIVPGIFTDWHHPRFIAHYTSADLVNWKYQSKLALSSERCIDASVFALPDGTWRMYYNNENDGKSIYYADSPDLYHWTDSKQKVVDTRGEGAKVFTWKGNNWMVIDSWNGLTVFKSADLVHWDKQEARILEQPGTGIDDKVKGGHADVVVDGDKAYIIYFTHPGHTPDNKGVDNYETRRSVIQIAELKLESSIITVNRDADVYIDLKKHK